MFLAKVAGSVRQPREHRGLVAVVDHVSEGSVQVRSRVMASSVEAPGKTNEAEASLIS